MTTFLWVMFVLHVIACLGYTVRLGKGGYPVSRTREAWEDIFSLWLGIGLTVWIAILLFL